MGTLREIFQWSQRLPDWQSDAIRRLFENDELAEPDIDDLLALLKTAHGIPDPQGRTAARPLTAELIPATPPKGSRTILKAIKEIQNVNAIAPDQRLEFASAGLTVIYGDNGSGKSGYSRILKRACRARDRGKNVLPNAFAPPAERGTPQAVFEFETEGREQSAAWRDGTPCDEALSAIAVFDNLCARTYLDKEHDVAYIPYGLGIFRELVRVFELLRSRLKKEQETYAVNLVEFSDLSGDTAVGRLVSTLSRSTTPASVNRLASFSEEESARINTLEKSLRENDPKGKAEALRRLKTRVDRFGVAFAALVDAFSDEAMVRVREADTSFTVAQEAARLAAAALFEGEELLPGTGGDAWKLLFSAARKFSEADAYVNRPFPVVSDGARCVLCQQILTDGGRRLSRFSAFIQQETEQNALKAEVKVKEVYERVSGLTPETALPDDTLLTEIQDLQDLLPRNIRDFASALIQRKEHVLAALKSHQWTLLPELPTDPIPALRALSGRLKAEATELERAAVGEEKKKIEAEYRELDARRRFAARKEAVLSAIGKLQMLKKLQDSYRAADTTAVSTKSTDMHQKRISADLSAALNREFLGLGAKHLKVVLAPRTERGKPLQKLKLNFPSPPPGADEISSILSEGEQRILAIASFLAEASLAHHGSGLVFDDPVSSLDHKYRQFVAERLVAEAARRQIIIFTHDVAFLFCLREACEKIEVPFLAQCLVPEGQRFGVVRKDLPFIARKSASRIAYLRGIHQKAEKLYQTGDTDGYENLIRSGYGLLRDTWERTVEEVLLRDVVQRFRRSVETLRLREVIVENSDVKTIYFAMAKCSRYEHDCARELQMPVPPPEEFLRDVEELAKYLSGIKKRAEVVKEARKSLFEAPQK